MTEHPEASVARRAGLAPRLAGVATLVAVALGVNTGPLSAQQAPALTPDGVEEAPQPVIEAFTIESAALGEDRRIRVTLPESHERTNRGYPLVVVLDGESLHDPVVRAARALVTAGHMPEAVMVGIENTDRVRDFSPPGLAVSGNDGTGRADLFSDFLELELRPALEATFRASGPVVIVGHSAGALFAHYAAARRPALFGNVVSLDAPMHLGGGALAAELLEGGREGRLRIVSLEARFGWPSELWTRFTASAPARWQLYRASMDGETHQSIVWPGAYDGLRQLFAEYSPTTSTAESAATRLAHFDASQPFGPTAPPPEFLLRQAVQDLVEARELEGAQEALGRLRNAYGDSAEATRLQAAIERADPDDLEGPPIEVLRETPMASADEAREAFGRWEGYTQQEGSSSRTPLVITIREEGDGAGGEIAAGGAPARAIEYLAVDGSQVHVGNMNGMRPRGMLMYEGKISGDVFEGSFLLRGVVFRLPDGSPLPTVHFRLERFER
ncbi:MAG: hypothetical protein HKN72_09375 [Gemmatimonadetes bacterium]|nr:hypothetical protein [Gemmatimonadota bacterium]